jgi:hypothetical protein
LGLKDRLTKYIHTVLPWYESFDLGQLGLLFDYMSDTPLLILFFYVRSMASVGHHQRQSSHLLKFKVTPNALGSTADWVESFQIYRIV